MWNLPAPPGFQGLHPDKPVHIYVRHLPHWRQEGATYAATFRLHDSLPQEKLNELAALRQEWERRNPPPHGDEQLAQLARATMRRVDRWLDLGMGSCRLKDTAAAQLVVDALHHFDGERYELDCYVIMPNHVHVVVRPFGAIDSLEDILHSWKGYTGQRINRLFGLHGSLWQDESFDRIIRHEEHLYRAVQYVGANARRAGLDAGRCPRWIRTEWQRLGWQFQET